MNPKVGDIGYPNVVLPGPPPSTPEDSSVKRQVSTSGTKAVGCGCNGARSWTRDFSYSSIESPEYEVNATPHLVTEKYYNNKKNKSINEKRRKKPTAKAKAKASTLPSSEGSNHWFSSEEENEESETPIYSSRSFSTDFSAVLETISEVSDKQGNKNKKSNNNKVRRLKRSVSKNWKETGEIGKIKSVFQPMRVCRRQGMVKESMAVVKKSEDPYEDFKKSMMEMIMEKQIFEARELEELLHCFLTLNSRHYQGVIVEAFSEIWKLVFTDTPSTSSEFYCFADKSQIDQMSKLKI